VEVSAENVGALITVGGWTPAEIGAVYQHQGQETNNCGPTNLAMVINLQLAGHGATYRVERAKLGDEMQASSRGFGLLGYRLTGLTGRVKGATPPWGMVRAYRKINAGLRVEGYVELGRMTWRVGGTREELVSNVGAGVLSTLMLVWKNLGAHYVTVVGYEPAGDAFLLLDPGTGRDKSDWDPPARLRCVPWPELDADWSRRPWWFLWQNRIVIETRGTAPGR
jgi:hypothetical protein